MTGGAGADSINFSGNVTSGKIVGGAGNDTFNFGSSLASAPAQPCTSKFNGADSIYFAGGSTVATVSGLVTIAVDSSRCNECVQLLAHIWSFYLHNCSRHLRWFTLHLWWCNRWFRWRWIRYHRIYLHDGEFLHDHRPWLIVHFLRLRWGPSGPLFFVFTDSLALA